jgi:hypothetical protein
MKKLEYDPIRAAAAGTEITSAPSKRAVPCRAGETTVKGKLIDLFSEPLTQTGVQAAITYAAHTRSLCGLSARRLYPFHQNPGKHNIAETAAAASYKLPIPIEHSIYAPGFFSQHFRTQLHAQEQLMILSPGLMGNDIVTPIAGENRRDFFLKLPDCQKGLAFFLSDLPAFATQRTAETKLN